MKGRIFLFSRDPGGANAIIPLVGSLGKKGYEIRLFGKDIALAQYAKAGLTGADIMGSMVDVELDSVESLLRDESPDLIITGTSSDDYTEKFIWKTAEKLDIPSFAVCDQWVNYGLRFSRFGVSDLDKYNADGTHPYLPTRILVMDDIAKCEAVKEGLDAERIVITGQPHFETLLADASAICEKDTVSLRSMYGVTEDDLLLTFASEPISDTYTDPDGSNPYWGYTERTVFDDLLNSLSKFAGSSKGKIVVILRPHPREKPDNYDDCLSGFMHERIRLIKDVNISSVRLILSSNLVCGMSSMFLIEAMVLGKPVISLQVGLSRENPFVPARLGLLRSILDADELDIILQSLIRGEALPKCSFRLVKNPVEQIIRLVETFLCPN